jgi:malonate-semialdehyde dehydrogenase (acetylating)/methylmalonate-semialdehyde dehydrogenase
MGMDGIIVPISAPTARHSFRGWRRSAFGEANPQGMRS